MDYSNINNIRIFNFKTRADLIKYADAEKKSLIAINAEKILHANEQTRTLINKNIGYADGIGAVWALHRKGKKDAVKIPGCELWLELVKYFQNEKSFYLVGSKEEVIQQTVAKLRSEYSRINIVGFRNGYIKTEEEKLKLLKDISQKKPDIVFVAMGSPKQELLMQEMQEMHPAIYQGLGGSFDVYVGNVERAPDWWIKNNLEWTYRLLKRPTRIKRQIHLVRFFWLLLINRI